MKAIRTSQGRSAARSLVASLALLIALLAIIVSGGVGQAAPTTNGYDSLPPAASRKAAPAPNPAPLSDTGALVVNTPLDALDVSPGDGVCDTGAMPGQATCSLRAAIQEANALGGARSIALPSGSYVLSIPGAGEDAARSGDLDVTGSITLEGAGALATTVNANGLDRVFHVLSGGSLTLSGLTITGGAVPDQSGGGILSEGSLTVRESVISGNMASNGGAVASGITNPDGASTAISRSTLIGNRAEGAASDAGDGGGLYLRNTTNIDTSAILDNYAADDGGGIAFSTVPPHVLTVENTTIGGNSANGSPGEGGGLWNKGSARVVLRHVTIARNSAGPGSSSGGIHNTATLSAANTLIAYNVGQQCNAPVSSLGDGYNISSAPDCGPMTVADPLLGPRGNYGGLTELFPLELGSPAIDAGDPNFAFPPYTDQRGPGYNRKVNGRVDVGAFEFGAGSWTVNDTGDGADVTPGDGACADAGGKCSLRAAIEETNSIPGPDRIYFDIPGVGVRAITLGSALPAIQDEVVLDGYTQPGAAPNTLSAGNDATLLIHLNGAAAPEAVLRLQSSNSVIRGLVIAGGGGTGIAVAGANNVIAGNYIGAGSSGSAAVGNQGDGVLVAGQSASARIGGTDPADRNVIAGNGGRGIYADGAAGTSSVTILNSTISGNGQDGIGILGAVSGSVEGALIRANGRAGISLVGNPPADNPSQGNPRILLSANAIYENSALGIDLGGDLVTFNHAGVISGPNAYQNYPLINVASAGDGQVRVAGVLLAPDGSYRIEYFANDACHPSQFGEGQTYLGFADVTAAGGSASFDTNIVVQVGEGQGLTATATNLATNETSEFSYCRPVSANNTNWVNAKPVLLQEVTDLPLFGSASQRILEVYQEKWFKFSVQPGDRARVTLSAPAGSAISLHRDPMPFYTELTDPGNAAALSASLSDVAFLPTGALPPGTLPSGSLPGGSLPTGSLPPGTLPGGFLPGGSLPTGSLPPGSLPAGSLPPGSLPAGSLPPGSLPGGSLPPGSLPGGALPPGSLPAGSVPPGSLPSGTLPPGYLSDAYSGAARRSLMAVSLDPYTTEHVIERNTYDLQEDLYIRVVGPYYPDGAFTVDIELTQGVCGNVASVPDDLALIAGAQPGDTDRKTLVLTDSSRLPGTAAEISAALGRLDTLKARPEVAGEVLDFADTARYPRVAFANQQADANTACPSAKNAVAREIKKVVDAYRAANVGPDGKTTVEYIVIAGNRSVIPFYQSADLAGMANEREYVPPVAPGTPSEAGLKLGRVQGQDFYGASVALNREGRLFFVPELAVGRIVDNAADISTVVDAYIATNGVVTPGSALVTGYDFVGDAATEIDNQLTSGLNTPGCSNANSCIKTDTLIQQPGLPPSDPSAWTASQLRAKLTAAGKDDLIVLTGHFAAGSLVAADYKTGMLASEISTAPADYTNSVVLALGCHGGFSIPKSDVLQDVSPDPDWAKAFLRRKAAGFVAASGYAYGSTTTIEWGERVFVDLSRQLRTGSEPVALGKALVRAKQAYLAKWGDQLDGYDEKTLAQMTLYGLPMMRVNMPGERLPVDSDQPVVGTPAPVQTGPGAGFSLAKAGDIAVLPAIQINQAPLQNLADNSTIVTTWASARDGVVVNPFEPLLPRERYNVSAAGYTLRGIAFRGGDYTDRLGVVPLTEAPTTETSRAHEAYYSDVFYPSQLWLSNYMDALSGGPERLVAVPGQYRSAFPGSVDGTLRTFSRLNFDLYYLPATWTNPSSPAPVRSAGVGAAPVIFGVSAKESGGLVTFSVNTLTDGTAGVQLVTVLYTGASGPFYGKWQPLDLARPAPGTEAASDPSIWLGTLPLGGQSPAGFEFIVQAISGSGLTTLATNNGAFYRLVPPAPPTPPQATSLVFQGAPASGTYLRDQSFTAKLSSGGQPLAGRVVLFSLAGQQKFGVTDANGLATVSIAPKVLPGAYTVQASFRGESAYQASLASSPFTLSKDPTTVAIAVPSDPANNITATARDSAGRPLGGKTLFFVLTGGGLTFSKAVIADIYGVAALGDTSLPTGMYNLTVYYNGVIDLGNGQTIEWPDDFYIPSSASAQVKIGRPPVVGPITAPVDPVKLGLTVNVSATFTDADKNDSHTARWDWGDGTTSAGVLTQGNGFVTVTGTRIYAALGVYTVKLTVTDSLGLTGQSVYQYVVVYSTDGTFITGGGWITSPAGSAASDPSATGKANFGFNARSQKGKTPTGSTQFKAGNLDFKSASYASLTISGSWAQVKGSGSLNGASGYKFILTVIDGQVSGGGGVDKFRMKITDSAGKVVYDNGMGKPDSSTDLTVLGGGSIQIHP